MTPFAQGPIIHALSRWVPVLAVLPATVGVVIAIGWPEYSEAGFALVAGGLALAIWLPLIGPVRLGGPRMVDEFDRMNQMRGWLAGCAAASFAAIIGMLMLLALGLAGQWSGWALLLAMRSLLTYLVVILCA